MSSGGILREAGEVRHRRGRRHACRLYIVGLRRRMRDGGRFVFGDGGGGVFFAWVYDGGRHAGTGRGPSPVVGGGYVKRGGISYEAGRGTPSAREAARAPSPQGGFGTPRAEWWRFWAVASRAGRGRAQKKEAPPGGSLRRGASPGGGDLLSRARAQYHRRGRA